MGQKKFVGQFKKGLQNNLPAIYLPDDAFPVLENAYQWRGRVKRKRGTYKYTRFQKYFNSTTRSYNSGTFTITLNVNGQIPSSGTLLNNSSWVLDPNGSIVPGTVVITGGGVYTDQGNGTFSPSGILNYSTGVISIPALASQNVTMSFSYYPKLPVMGIEEKENDSSSLNVFFDTKYAYQATEITTPPLCYNVSFYKNPSTGTYINYVQKTTPTPLKWNGENYRQFYTLNYQNSLWACNSLPVPFEINTLGMQFKVIDTVTIITPGNPATSTPAVAEIRIPTHGLRIGDFLFINEVQTTTGINLQTGYVTAEITTNRVRVSFQNAVIANNGSGGIAQYLTRSANDSKDCMRWYDGDPTNGNPITPVLNTTNGWVNFCPPLSNSNFNVAELPLSKYYLVTAKMMIAYRDRLVFLGPVVQSSSSDPIYLQDTVIFCQNGTPYYTCSFNDDPTLSNTVFNPILVPINQTATANSWFEDVIGYGGYRSIGRTEEITTVEYNEDVPILGFQTFQTKLIYTSNDIQPFDFYYINSEYGSNSTFSTINTDQGVITKGNRGIIITNQNETQRIDLDIPDQIFEMKLANNGNERFTAIRDFQNEWIYFTYVSNNIKDGDVFPNETLFYNYRDRTWAIFKENFTTYGYNRGSAGYTWGTIGLIFPTWSSWNVPWNSGYTTPEQIKVLAGNQQGYIFIRGDGTSEAEGLEIVSFTGPSPITVNSPNHGLVNDEYIYIKNCLGTIGSVINNVVFRVGDATQNTFKIYPQNALVISGTYFGLGQIVKLYRPFIQSKQFPGFWDQGRKTLLGVQQYLFTTTSRGQCQILIYLNQNPDDPYNDGPVYPTPNALNTGLIYSNIIYTCPESSNIGLTPPNVNLQQPDAIKSSQIWHRFNPALIGDSVQIAVTLSDEQMYDPDIYYQTAEIELYAYILDLSPAGVLA